MPKKTTEKSKQTEFDDKNHIEVQDIPVQTEPINLSSIIDRVQIREEVRVALKQMCLELGDDHNIDMNMDTDSDSDI